jgi:hypothetical protein
MGAYGTLIFDLLTLNQSGAHLPSQIYTGQAFVLERWWSFRKTYYLITRCKKHEQIKK